MGIWACRIEERLSRQQPEHQLPPASDQCWQELLRKAELASNNNPPLKVAVCDEDDDGESALNGRTDTRAAASSPAGHSSTSSMVVTKHAAVCSAVTLETTAEISDDSDDSDVERDCKHLDKHIPAISGTFQDLQVADSNRTEFCDKNACPAIMCCI